MPCTVALASPRFISQYLHALSSPTPKTKTDVAVQEKVLPEEEKQVIVHCHYTCTNPWGMYIRIWPTTYLVAKDIKHRSSLVHAENIPYYPAWKAVEPGASSQFTLVFTGLPSDCARFDLVEEIPQEGGFYVGDIARNEMDVYEVNVDG